MSPLFIFVCLFLGRVSLAQMPELEVRESLALAIRCSYNIPVICSVACIEAVNKYTFL